MTFRPLPDHLSHSITGIQDMTASIFFYFDLFLLLIFGSKISTLTILYLLYQSLYRLFTRQLFLSKPASETATRTLEPVHARS